jgi:glycosyltransferase involved in cell wall biosynthesis
MNMATKLLPFSNYSRQEAVRNAGISERQMSVVYLGVPDPFCALPANTKERIALTVGNIEWPNLQRKGMEPFVRAAAHLPDVKFVVVGAWADDSIEHLRSIASPNVTFTGRVSDAELLDWYRRASVYVQASLHEGFGLSVAEAMLAGCIPVVTRRGSLPEVVGEQGLYCDPPDPSEIASTVRIALNSPASLREAARQRVLSHFPMQQRKRALEQLLQNGWNNDASQ